MESLQLELNNQRSHVINLETELKRLQSEIVLRPATYTPPPAVVEPSPPSVPLTVPLTVEPLPHLSPNFIPMVEDTLPEPETEELYFPSILGSTMLLLRYTFVSLMSF